LELVVKQQGMNKRDGGRRFRRYNPGSQVGNGDTLLCSYQRQTPGGFTRRNGQAAVPPQALEIGQDMPCSQLLIGDQAKGSLMLSGPGFTQQAMLAGVGMGACLSEFAFDQFLPSRAGEQKIRCVAMKAPIGQLPCQAERLLLVGQDVQVELAKKIGNRAPRWMRSLRLGPV